MHNRKTWIFLFLLIFITMSLFFFLHYGYRNKKKDILYYRFKALSAYQKKDYSAFLNDIKKAIELAPNNPTVMYELARAYALNDNKKAAITWLERYIETGFYIDSDKIDDFESIKNLDKFKGILRKNQEMKFPVTNSKIAFSIPEKDLIPEGIAYDPVKEVFYIGSIYKCKIISINKQKTINNFTSEKQDGLLSVTGIKLDAKRRILWVNSSEFYRMKGFDKNKAGYTCIFKYNIDNRKLIKKYILDERPIFHHFNDLVINSQGDVFVTDSLFGAIYKIDHKSDTLDIFIKPNRFTYPNGIALSQDERYLFVTHVEGTSVVDINTKSYYIMPHPKNIPLTGIEGLYLYKNTLLAIQDDHWYGRVIQLSLQKSSNKDDNLNNSLKYSVQKAKLIEVGNHLFSHPTTGVIVGDFFYYIANSQQLNFNEDMVIYPIDKFDDILVLKVKL
jgi:hypothetical protein